MPCDKLDEACLHHDMNLFAAKYMDGHREIEAAKREADRIFGETLRTDLRPLKKPVYGSLYVACAQLIFKP